MDECYYKKEIKYLEDKENIIYENIKTQIVSNKGEYPLLDGIIDLKKYVSSKYKILWILREPIDNWRIDTNTKENIIGGWNLSKDLYSKSTFDTICSNVTTRRELLIDYAILYNIIHKESELHKYTILKTNDEKEKALECFKSTAVINIKKIPGKKLSIKKEINNAFYKYKNIILEQISLYNPDIVICGNTLQYFEDYLDFRKGDKFPTGIKGHNYFCLKNRIYINIYHPSNKPFKNTKYEHKYIHCVVSAVRHWEKDYKECRTTAST